MTYLIADTHFGHFNSIRYCDRPYFTVEEMDKSLLTNWNNTVKENDIVFHLGDVCFKWNKERTADFIHKLNGHKILIMGNHDASHTTTYWKEVGFEEVTRSNYIYNNYLLSHYPQKELNGMKNIFGHIHQKPLDPIEFLHQENYICVCVEIINYTPILFEEAIK